MLKRRVLPSSSTSSAYPRWKPIPSRFASSKSGRVASPGISRSKKRSASARSSYQYRGKKVVRASSGYTTSRHPAAAASRMSATSRATTCSRVSAR